ncbi:adenine phosphoribosyltransferase [Solitalea koreensis]|uniref:Adenine phosphoribosyltransferase n=1 Tax=Solitalea koreensis TaxID=543615 RepID=A0A521DTY2_9SPHI|nr:adenine phosphoribosyltransferase [Solitalea koreensis]SMO74581.1 adenine phosphoribosyltransferase [Solitalea koreensis]
MTIEQKLKSVVRDIIDFPKEGIVFKDITPILKDPGLCREIVDEYVRQLEGIHIDEVAAIESRGFFFGVLIAQRLNVPFVPIRKKGKLPYKTIAQSYKLEYGEAIIEVHEDAIVPGQSVLIHDDLLATGGTVGAAAKLIEKLGAKVEAVSFLIELDFLNGREKLKACSENIISLIRYP